MLVVFVASDEVRYSDDVSSVTARHITLGRMRMRVGARGCDAQRA